MHDLALAQRAARDGPVDIGFLEDCRVGMPLTLVPLALGWLILVLLPG